jgi:hypothetical protein
MRPVNSSADNSTKEFNLSHRSYVLWKMHHDAAEGIET